MSTTQTFEVSRQTSDIRTRALAPAIGAEIIGVDLSAPMSEETFAKVLDCWHENLVILFRDQHLTEDDQVRFGERFGPPAVSHTRRYTTKNPAVMLISNIRENGQLIGALPDGEMNFHTDQCHQERPAMASMLYALEIPSTGGNTLFANAYLAYETLPQPLKKTNRRPQGAQCLRLRQRRDEARHQAARRHSVVLASHRQDPSGHGAKGALRQPADDGCHRGTSDAEGEALLDTLFDHQEEPQFIYEHVWRPHDLLLWDNRCTLHARTDFSAAERRLMRRLTILGEKPV